MKYEKMTKQGLISLLKQKDSSGDPGTEDKDLAAALAECRQREEEFAFLLEGARTVLDFRNFYDTARSLFDSCKKLLRASAGYVAILSRDKKNNDVLFLEAGGKPCRVDPALPMPIRGLRAKVYRNGQALFHNQFNKSHWTRWLPKEHVTLFNVLFAPMKIKGEVVGLLGLANKPGGFTQDDARLATAFGELAAIALSNSRTYELLETSEERFRALALTARDAIIIVDVQGKILFWNQGSEKMFGYASQETLHKMVTLIIPKRFRKHDYEEIRNDILSDESEPVRSYIEKVGRRKDGREFPIEFSLSRWKTREGTFITVIIRDVAERRKLEEKLQNYNTQMEREIRERTDELIKANQTLKETEARLRLLSSQHLQAEEQERKRIAREIHDSLGQSLSAVKFGIENAVLQMKGKGVDEARLDLLQPLIGLVKNTLEEVRRIIMDLRPSTLDDIGILATISWFCREFENLYHDIHIEKNIEVKEEEIPVSIKTVIYRVMQEALNNVSKHSRASRVILCLRKTDSRLELILEDNGRGFNDKKASSLVSLERGFGLASMRERVELSGGSFELKAQKGLGTRIRAVWISR